MTTAAFPTLFVPHGAGPCFFMEWDPAGTWDRMQAWLQDIVKHAGARPRALLVVSGHWEEPVVTVNTAESHNLLLTIRAFPNTPTRSHGRPKAHRNWPAKFGTCLIRPALNPLKPAPAGWITVFLFR